MGAIFEGNNASFERPKASSLNLVALYVSGGDLVDASAFSSLMEEGSAVRMGDI